ncbi:hypothetical protein HID58_034082, partial [Brassica napus]
EGGFSRPGEILTTFEISATREGTLSLKPDSKKPSYTGISPRSKSQTLSKGPGIRMEDETSFSSLQLPLLLLPIEDPPAKICFPRRWRSLSNGNIPEFLYFGGQIQRRL